MDLIAADYPSELIDLAQARRQRLEDEELRLLGCAVGDHLPVELSLRVEALRELRAGLVPGDGPLGA